MFLIGFFRLLKHFKVFKILSFLIESWPKLQVSLKLQKVLWTNQIFLYVIIRFLSLPEHSKSFRSLSDPFPGLNYLKLHCNFDVFFCNSEIRQFCQKYFLETVYCQKLWLLSVFAKIYFYATLIGIELEVEMLRISNKSNEYKSNKSPKLLLKLFFCSFTGNQLWP